jgi:hypothetical protein
MAGAYQLKSTDRKGTSYQEAFEALNKIGTRVDPKEYGTDSIPSECFFEIRTSCGPVLTSLNLKRGDVAINTGKTRRDVLKARLNANMKNVFLEEVTE